MVHSAVGRAAQQRWFAVSILVVVVTLLWGSSLSAIPPEVASQLRDTRVLEVGYANTSVIWSLRPQESPERADYVVLDVPMQNLESQMVDVLREWVRAGHGALVATQRSCGVFFDESEVQTQPLRPKEVEVSPTHGCRHPVITHVERAWFASTGSSRTRRHVLVRTPDRIWEPLLETEDGHVVLAAAQYGKGRILVAAGRLQELPLPSSDSDYGDQIFRIFDNERLGVNMDQWLAGHGVPGHASAPLNRTGSGDVGTFPSSVWLSDLHPIDPQVGWGTFTHDATPEGAPISVGGLSFDRGIWAHANSSVSYRLHGWFSTFRAFVGIDDNGGRSAEEHRNLKAIFRVHGDGALLFESPALGPSDAALEVSVNTRGVDYLMLTTHAVGPRGIDERHTCWGGAEAVSASPSLHASRRATLSRLEALAGAYPYELVDVAPELQEWLAALFGHELSRYTEWSAVQSPVSVDVTDEGRFLIISGCEAHNCPGHNTMVVINLDSGQMWGGLRTGSTRDSKGEVEVFADSSSGCPESVLSWSRFYTFADEW